MTENKLIRDMIAASPDRRGFVKKLGLAGAMATAAMTSTSNYAYAQAAITDLDIVQFALNLEYLEAEFYTAATTGQTITKVGVDDRPRQTGVAVRTIVPVIAALEGERQPDAERTEHIRRPRS